MFRGCCFWRVWYTCIEVSAVRENVMYRVVGRDPMFKTWHISGQHMLIYMESEGGCIVCREKTWPIRRGVLCFVGAQKYHYTMPDEPETYVRSKLFLSPAALERLQKLPEKDTQLRKLSAESFVYAVIPEDKQEETGMIFREAAESQEREGEELTLFSCWLRLLVLLEKCASENIAPAGGYIGKAIEYMNRNIAEPLDVDTISSIISVSKYHFCRTFRAATGLTVMQYIQRTRIMLAQSLLRETALPVTEICGKCGFASLSHFCRVFREETGLTPLQYRTGEKK